MAIEETPMGLWKPDGNERVKDGDDVIAHNAQRTQELVDWLQARTPVMHFDGGSPSSTYDDEPLP